VNLDVPNRAGQVGASGRDARWVSWVILGTVCALVISFFAWSARPGWLGMRTARAEDAYYNLMVRGFRAGQLDLKAETPPGFAQLADPYDPVAHLDFLLIDGHPLWDLSYYHGKWYAYFGVTPALVLFWPYAALTGHYLWHQAAVVVFCAVGFLASVGLFCLIWRRYFPEIGLVAVTAGTLALGLAAVTPIILPRAEVFEVAISCGYALTTLSLLALWEACHRPQQRGRWLAAASLAYGLAVGARPNLLFGAVILLVPIGLAWREGRMRKAQGRRQNEEDRGQKSEEGDTQPATSPPSAVWLGRTGNSARSQILTLMLAAAGPITCIGLGLLLYNYLRFDNPLEFGTQYQLSDIRMRTLSTWNRHWFGFNAWVYFLGPARWGGHFPFVQDIKPPPLTAGHGNNEHPFGVLTNVPVVWLALAVPLVWRGRSAEVRWILRAFLAAVALVFATRALTLCFFRSAHARYQMEFWPALMLLAVVGILGLERALASRPTWRRATRWAWGLLLAFSLAFNLLASSVYHAEYHLGLGSLLLERGQVPEAIANFQEALALRPEFAMAHYNLGVALGQKGQADEAVRQYQEAVRLEPELADARNNLGEALDQRGQIDEAIRQYQEVLRLNPDHADAHNNLGAAFVSKDQLDEAIRQYQEALRLKPNHVEAHNNLGMALGMKGQTDEAIRQFQEAVRLKPEHTGAHYNLGVALTRQGRVDEAIRQYQEVLRLKPDNADARRNLDAVLAAKTGSAPPAGPAINR
jgi:tetratricopeptide (TPR) repeat protein